MSEGATLVFGGAVEEPVTLKFPHRVEMIANYGIGYQHEAGVLNTHWIGSPQLHADGITVKGVVHWGVSWASGIEFNPWAEGWEFVIRL